VKSAISCQILARSFEEASQRAILNGKIAISCQILGRSFQEWPAGAVNEGHLGPEKYQNYVQSRVWRLAGELQGLC